MIAPVNGHLLVVVETIAEEQDGFAIGNTNRYDRLNRGHIKHSASGDWVEGVKVFFNDFQGVEVDKNLIVLHEDDIVAYEKE